MAVDDKPAGGTSRPVWSDTWPAGTRPVEPQAPMTRLPLRHAVSFEGSGSEYFRIWIVNLLATLLTLGLYYPWARLRKLRYFHTNTFLDGHAFDFHGNARRMLRGFVLVWLLLLAYNAASKASPTAALVALVVLGAVWPALWHASLRFRLGNTSWRGLRFAFEGSLAGAYRAYAGLLLIVAGVIALGLGLPGASDNNRLSAGDGLAIGWRLAAMLALLVGVLPATWYAIKRYQHRHYAYAGLTTQWQASRAAVYGVLLRTLGVGLLAAACIAAAVFAWVALASAGGPRGGAGVMVGFMLSMILFWALQAVPAAYLQSRMQNLVWTRTLAPGLRFDSELGFRPAARLMLKNGLLTVLTLGLYWPWAAVATARLRLSALTVVSDAPLDELASERRAGMSDAAGDAAGDALGIDFGL